ncbi:MAG: GTP cyclohydrolase FolE2 [Candidatus Gastranaerophilales bacterium]|nr:GTP cyclohydrolase FolE2 [Candidatus Gastranaerophilales bacterium]
MTKLADIQNQDDARGIDIQKVGVNGVEVPLIIQRKNAENQVVSATARMSVALPKKYRGTHMSRFMEVLNEYRIKNLLGIDIKGILIDIQKKLQAKSAHVKFNFKYFIEKKAPISKAKFPMGYDCSFEGNLHGEDYKFILGVKVPVTTLCPCSKEISENSAHNQRAIIKVKIGYAENDHIWLEDLIDTIEKCGSCPIHPLLKRSDEKFVTEAAYKNPKFVEDALRDIVGILKKNKIINFYEVEIEAQESIHTHNAWAYQSETKE